MRITSLNIKKLPMLAGRKIHITARWMLTLIVVLSVTVSNSLADDLRLEIGVPNSKVRIGEPLNLTVKLINGSEHPYYVSGAIELGSGGLGHQFGTYQLQVRRSGAGEFVNGPGNASDGLPGRNPTTLQFIIDNQLVLLRPDTFLGTTINSDWDGLTLLPPGRYSIRVTYTSYGRERDIPQDLPFPIFRLQLTSNVIDIDIQP
jgi:hypothetical protein